MTTGHHRQITIQQNPLVHHNNTSQALNGTYNRINSIITEIQTDMTAQS